MGEAQKHERQALSDGSYRETEPYQQGLRDLQQQHDQALEQKNEAFRQVENGLNERFGFDRERSRDDDRSARGDR